MHNTPTKNNIQFTRVLSTITDINVETTTLKFSTI